MQPAKVLPHLPYSHTCPVPCAMTCAHTRLLAICNGDGVCNEHSQAWQISNARDTKNKAKKNKYRGEIAFLCRHIMEFQHPGTLAPENNGDAFRTFLYKVVSCIA